MKNYSMPIILAIIMAVLAVSGFVIASPSGMSQEEKTYALEATKKFSGAKGTAMVGSDRIHIEAAGLRPNRVYTVWFVNMSPKKHETGAGSSPYMFKTDAYGNGVYSSSLETSPHGKWKMLMVVEHPNGDPMDMKNMVGALSTTLE